MIISILMFVLLVVVHLLVFGLCVSARAGDDCMEKFIEEYRRRK